MVASRADKQVMANVQTPGEYIVVMMGMNQTTCNPGEVVRIVMERLGNEPKTDWDLGLARQTLSSIDGTVIDSQALPYRPVLDPVQPPEKSEDTPGPSKRDPSGESKRTEDSRKLPGFGLEAVAGARAAGEEVAPSQVIVDGGEAAADASQKRLKAAVAAKDQVRGAIDASAPLKEGVGGGRDEDLVAETTKSEFGKSELDSDNRHASSAPRDVMNVASAMEGARTVERNYTNASDTTPSAPVQAKTSVAPLTRIAVGVGMGIALAAAAILFGLRRRRLG
jgi:hypothetical protein